MRMAAEMNTYTKRDDDDDDGKMMKQNKKEGQQHQVFPCGHPSQY